MSKYMNGTVAALTITLLIPAPALPDEPSDVSDGHRVLLISIDGMHALDYQNCVAANTCSTVEALGDTGVNYTHVHFSSVQFVPRSDGQRYQPNRGVVYILPAVKAEGTPILPGFEQQQE
jgi:hypothetical protein